MYTHLYSNFLATFSKLAKYLDLSARPETLFIKMSFSVFFCFTKYIFIYTIFFLIRINIFIRTLFLSWDNILSCSLTCQHNEIQQVIQHKSQFLPLSFYQVQFQISTLSFLNYQNYYLYQGLEQILFFHILSVLLCPNFAMFCLAFTLLSNLFWQPQILCFSRFHDRNL